MKATHLSISAMALGSLFLFSACTKKKTGTGGDSEDNANSGYVLYSETNLLPVGSVSTKTEKMSMKDVAMTLTMQGQEVKGTMSRVGESVEVQTIDSDSQITLEIQKDEASGSAVMNGQAMPQPKETEPLHEKTVILTKSGDTWSAKLKEGEADTKEAEAIEKIAEGFNSPDDKAILGTTARNVGDTWDVNPADLGNFGGGSMEELSGTFKVTFKSVKEHQGHECAELHYEFDLKGKSNENMEMAVKGQATLFQSVKYATGVSFFMDCQLTLEGGMEGLEGSKMQMKGGMTIEGANVIKLP